MTILITLKRGWEGGEITLHLFYSSRCKDFSYEIAHPNEAWIEGDVCLVGKDQINNPTD